MISSVFLFGFGPPRGVDATTIGFIAGALECTEWRTNLAELAGSASYGVPVGLAANSVRSAAIYPALLQPLVQDGQKGIVSMCPPFSQGATQTSRFLSDDGPQGRPRRTGRSSLRFRPASCWLPCIFGEILAEFPFLRISDSHFSFASLCQLGTPHAVCDESLPTPPSMRHVGTPFPTLVTRGDWAHSVPKF